MASNAEVFIIDSSADAELSARETGYSRLESCDSQDVTETSFITQPTTSQMSRYNPINDSANADTLTSSDLDIDTTGDSLKLCSRHVPGYSARRSTASQSAGSDDEEVEDTDVTNMEPEFVTEAYVEVGEALSSPQVLSGVMNLAAIFTRKAVELPHFYKSRGLLICLILSLFSFALSAVFSIIFDDQKEITRYSYIPMFTPLGLLVLAALLRNLVMACSGSLLLRSRLEALEPFLELCQISAKEYSELFLEPDHGIYDYKVVGSAGDGFGFFASEGSNKIPFEDRSLLNQDIDLNIFMNTLRVEKRHLRNIPGALGFTWFVLTDLELQHIKDPVIKKCFIPVPGTDEHFLSGRLLLQETSSFFMQACSASGSGQLVQSSPALTFRCRAFGPNGSQLYEVDYAFALRYPDWPDEAEEWTTRQRSGIDQYAVDSIASRGCYLVHKPCDQVTAGPHLHDYDWRYTFAAAEADLFHYHRDKKALRLCFVILKFLIKVSTVSKGPCATFLFESSISNLFRGNLAQDSPVLRSYHLKTIFLWMAEEETTLDYYTIKGNKDLGKVFLSMLDRYCHCIEQKCLPNYFMRNRNMLSHVRYQDQHFVAALNVLKSIRKRPTLNMLKFETSFVNKRALIILLVGGFVVVIIANIGRTIANSVSNQLYKEANQLFWEALLDDSKYFTHRYVTFLQNILYDNSTRAST